MKRFFGNVLAVIVGNLLTIFTLGLFLLVFLLFSMSGEWFKGSPVKSGSVLEITFDAPINESAMDDKLSFFGPEPGEGIYLRDVLRMIKQAKEDDKIEGISLRVGSFGGGASQLTDIRNALADFKTSGKFIYAYSHNSDQSAYMLNSVADSLFQNPLGMVMLEGFSAEVLFFKNFGDKYGIDFQVIRHGDYKSAVEPFMRDDLSSENREQLTLLLNDMWDNLSSSVADSRKISTDKFNEYTDSLYAFNPNSALRYKLVDKIASTHDYEKALADRMEIKRKDNQTLHESLKKRRVSLSDYAETLKSKTSKNRVAILYASGAISSGDGYSGIQSETYKKAIREIKDNDKIKAVVLRVNSPGGSADASEEILQELKLLREKKPIIVSFGDVAASGGYYISTASDSIFASPNTITGSIGVLGMIPSFKKLVNNFGINADYVKTNENAEFLKSFMEPLSETGMQTMTEMTENVYKIFVEHVMESRNMTFEEVDAIGGGRVWSGTQALKIGLIDRFGTLEDAVEAAAAKAGLEDYSVRSYPVRPGGLEEMLAQYGVSQTTVILKEELGAEYYEMFKQLKAMREYEGIQLRMPFELIIK